MPPKFRKRPREDEVEDDEDSLGDKKISESELLRTKLAMVREDQKLRARGAGVDASSLSLGNLQRAEEQRIELQKSAAAAEVAAKCSALLSLGSFEKSEVGALSTGRGKSGEELEDPKMVAYVEERLRLLRQQESEVTSGGKLSGKVNSGESQLLLDASSESIAAKRDDKKEEEKEDEVEYLQNPSKMYAIPAHLDVSDRGGGGGGGGGRKRNDADVGAGGVMLGGTGIAEIALPEKDKHDLERKTLEAVNKLMAERNAADEERRRRQEINAGGLTSYGSVSSNFDHHRRQWISNERSSGSGGRGVKPGQATDNKIVSLFKKREREGISNR